MRLRAELVAVLIATSALAQTPPPPEECLAAKGERAAASVEHGGKRYAFRSAECRDEFLKDPERWSQLYDALAELAAEGTKLEAREASLVPS